ncbi:hypothetical protein RRF57_011416 [Xylaria bambusicola]|uniref:Uncharacterized protein n=1 Tax=Xylaria bambusicola TaxID=326684 RepID=A0AAN7V4K1_9PEZI
MFHGYDQPLIDSLARLFVIVLKANDHTSGDSPQFVISGSDKCTVPVIAGGASKPTEDMAAADPAEISSICCSFGLILHQPLNEVGFVNLDVGDAQRTGVVSTCITMTNTNLVSSIGRLTTETNTLPCQTAVAGY